MEHFVTKRHEVEATQFIGTATDATRIVNWIQAHGGSARFHEAGERRPGPGRGIKTLPAYIAIQTFEDVDRAEALDWVIRNEKGQFYSCSPEVFDETYDAIPEIHLIPEGNN
jgi:hypothetical protein